MRAQAYTVAIAILAFTSQSFAEKSYLVWTDAGTVYRSRGDGSNKQVLLAGSGTVGQRYYDHVDIDQVTGEVYTRGHISDGSTGSVNFVGRVSQNGTGYQDVIGPGTSIGHLSYGFAVSGEDNLIVTHNHASFAGFDETFRIRTAALDGSSLQKLPLTVLYAHDIDIDSTANLIYYTDASSSAILRMNYDGSNNQTILANPNGDTFNIAIDRLNNLIYFSDNFGSAAGGIGGGARIGVMNLDGSSLTNILSGLPLTDIEDIEVDPIAGKLYWIARGGVYSSLVDGTDITLLSAVSTSAGTGFTPFLSLAVTSVPEVSTNVLILISLMCVVVIHRLRRFVC
jgi:hypothetical protein